MAALTFGFWPGLFIRTYDRSIAIPVIQSRLLTLPTQVRSRGAIEQRLKEIARFRNRVFHHEPIWNRPMLWQDYRNMVDTIAWLPQEFALVSLLNDEFYDVYHRGIQGQRRHLFDLLNIEDMGCFDPGI